MSRWHAVHCNESRHQRYGDNHFASAGVTINLGKVPARKDAYREAEEFLLEALRIRRAEYGLDHELIHSELQSLVDLYDAWGRPRQATKYRRLQVRCDRRWTRQNSESHCDFR